jgi:flagellar protein FlbD
MLTRLGGQPMAVNPDLIEKAEATPDTVITLVDGHKFVVAESVEVVVRRVRGWRASVAAEAFALAEPPASGFAGPGAAPSGLADGRPADGTAPGSGLTGTVGAGRGEAFADRSGGGPLARVLRLPAREE